MAPPALDQHPGFFEAVEDLAIEELVPELAVEGPVVAIFPGAAGRDIEGLHIDPAEPVADRLGRELAAVARREEQLVSGLKARGAHRELKRAVMAGL